MQPVEGQHDEEEYRRRCDHQPALVDGIDEPAGQRPAGDGADLKETHGQSRLHIAAAETVHDENGQCGYHDVLRHEEEQIAAAHAQEFRCPKSFSFHTIPAFFVLIYIIHFL